MIAVEARSPGSGAHDPGRKSPRLGTEELNAWQAGNSPQSTALTARGLWGAVLSHLPLPWLVARLAPLSEGM